MKFNKINRGLFFIVSVILVSGTLHSIQASQNEEPEYSFYPEINDNNINDNNINENLGANNLNVSLTLNTSVQSYQQQQPAFVAGFPVLMMVPVRFFPINTLFDKLQNIENTCNEYRDDQKIILDKQNTILKNQTLILKKLSDLEYEQCNAKRKIHNIYSQVNKDNYNSIPRRIQLFRKETNEQFNEIKQYLQNNISNKEGLKNPQTEYNNIGYKSNRNKYYKNNYNKYFK